MEAKPLIEHHADCDGWRTAHRITVETDGHGLRRFVCAECGPLHIGSFGKAVTAVETARMFAGHQSEVECDGRCRQWA